MFRMASMLLLLAVFLQSVVESTLNSSPNHGGQSPPGRSYCGQRPLPSRTRVRRVIGGEEASAHAWPWQVLILNGSSANCGGSIISPTWLITSAHCTDETYDRIIYVGKHRVNETDIHEQKLEVEDIHIHENYIRGNDTSYGDNDMALVKLKHPIKFTSFVHAVCLPDTSVHFKPGHECFLSGWGITDVETQSNVNTLRQVKLPLVSQDVCNSEDSYGGRINRRYFCAGLREGGKDGCTYDSGGPLVCPNEVDKWFLIGMMSWGDGCAKPMKYGVYLNITEMMPVIKEKVKDLPVPYSPTPTAKTTTKDDTTTKEESKERLFVAIICALCVVIVLLLATLCIVHFYIKGYICCTTTETGRRRAMPKSKSSQLLEANGKLNKDIGV